MYERDSERITILFDKKTMVAVPQHECTLNMKDINKYN